MKCKTELVVSVTEFRKILSAMMASVIYKDMNVIIEKIGTPVCVLVNYEDYKSLLNKR